MTQGSHHESIEKSGLPAMTTNFEDFGEGYGRVLACGGSEEDPHMVEMEMVFDAATPHAECPKCGHRVFLHNVEAE